MSKEIVKSDSLIPFLNQKYKADLKYRKDTTIERKEVFINKVETVNEEDGTVWCTISTEDVDRMGDIVIAGGIDTSEFKKIPSVYKNHDYAQDPVATCEEMVFKERSVMAKVKFAPLTVQCIKDTWEKVKAGTMRGVSIGFDATQVILKGTKAFDEICKEIGLDAESYAKTRRVIKNWMLYEFSIVGIPANSNCYTKSVEEPKIITKVEEKAVEKPKEIKELSKGAKVEMEDHAGVLKYLKEKGFTEEETNSVFEMIAADELRDDPEFYKDEDNQELEEEVEKTVDITEIEKDIKKIEETPIVENYMGDYKSYDDFILGTIEISVEEVENTKPYKAEHRARQNSPNKYKKFRRKNDAGGAGIDFIYGITDAGKAEIQSIAADASKFSVEEFRKWLKDHKFKTNIEPAKGKGKDKEVKPPEIKRYIKVIQTPIDTELYIKKCVEARCKGKTRISIVE